MAVVIERPITGPAAWRGEELARSVDWIRPIAPVHVDELDAALRRVKARGLTWHDITREDFRLPGMSRALADVSDELERGRYHGRTAYEDEDATDSDRLLLRLWLSMPNSRPLPEGFDVLWGSIEAGALRGGIAQTPACG